MADTTTYTNTDWLTSDKESGLGRGTIDFEAPSWSGRETRYAIRVVQKENGNKKAISFKQLGVAITTVSPERIDFPTSGGDRQIMVTTNAASLIATITTDSTPNSSIKAFTTASGLTITVNDISVSYGFPGDPGKEGTFEVSLIVSMPENTTTDERLEYITINGVLIPLYQPAGEQSDTETEPEPETPYLAFDHDFDMIEGDVNRVVVDINSNIDWYTIEIIDCEESEDEGDDEEVSLVVSPSEVTLSSSGQARQLNIAVTPETTGWNISNV